MRGVEEKSQNFYLEPNKHLLKKGRKKKTQPAKIQNVKVFL